MEANVTVYDNGGRTFDRYTVILRDHDYALGIGATGNVPNGFCMSIDLADIVEGEHLGKEITLDEMTEPARKAVIAELVYAAGFSISANRPLTQQEQEEKD